MRVMTMSQIVVTLSALTLAGACNDSYSPSPVAPPSGGIALVPRNATLQAGQVVALKASLIDEHGDRIDGLAFVWRSSDDAVATVASSGEVYGRGVGFALITATAEGRSQIATIRVLPKESKPDSKGEKPKPHMEPARLSDR
jgi:uncharacterized protein YjdB